MNYEIVFLTKPGESIQEPQGLVGENIQIENAVFILYKLQRFSTVRFYKKAVGNEVLPGGRYYNADNVEFWDCNRLIQLEQKLITSFGKSKKIVIAIHWGRLNLTDAEKHTNKLLHQDKELLNSSISWTYYSKAEDNLGEITDYQNALPMIIERVSGFLKNTLIDLWLPIAIDIQGLKDDKKKNLFEYFKGIQTDVKSLIKSELYKNWIELEKSGTLKNIENASYPQMVMESISNTLVPEQFYNEYVINEEKSFPLWFDKAIKKLNAK